MGDIEDCTATSTTALLDEYSRSLFARDKRSVHRVRQIVEKLTLAALPTSRNVLQLRRAEWENVTLATFRARNQSRYCTSPEPSWAMPCPLPVTGIND